VTNWVHGLAVASYLAVWLAGVLDLSRRPDLPITRRVGWALVMLLVPTLGAVAYVLARPVTVARLPADDGDSAATVPPDDGVRERDPRGARAVRQFASKAAGGLFRSVEVLRPASVPPSGPQLWCVSHFGALSDPIVLLHALDRPPRFLAGDFLWKVPVLRRALQAVRAIPVRRTQDGGGGNRGMFAASVDALAEGDLVAVFPEGVATEGAQVAPLRTGAARIALGAVAAGVTGVSVVPAGVHYRDRAALRRRVFVDVGDPLDLDAWCAERTDRPRPDDRALVRALTDELDRRLRDVAPQFADVDEAHALYAAAHIALTEDPSAPPTWARRAELAARLGRASAGDRAGVVAAVDDYRAALDAAGLSDVEVVARDPASRRYVAAGAILGVLLVPFALLGAVLHAPLAVLVGAIGRSRLSRPTLATVLPVVGLVGALLTWGVAAWWLSAEGPIVVGRSGGGLARAFAVLQWLLVLPVWGWAALALGERLANTRRAVRTRRRLARSSTAAVLPAMREQRDEVVARVGRAAHG
jgi:glycerol-3-phosphate O-acyltransferase / dihydroxyacetone phosphate acyltransferase